VSRFPDVSTAGAAVPASIFARLREHLARFTASGGDFIPLQIGDTYLPPPLRLHEVTGVPPDRLDEGIDRVNAVLARR